MIDLKQSEVDRARARKPTVEEARCIKIARIIERYPDRPAELKIGNGVVLHFARTRQRLGGERMWIVCGCGRRCSTLFWTDDERRPYACRECAGLCYASQLA